MKVAIASCRVIPEPDPDEALLLAKFHERGVDARVLAWDDAAAPFADHDLVVLRSTWNYFQEVDAFLAWVERTALRTAVLNPPAIVRWNVKKTYLRALEQLGIAIVPTHFVTGGAPSTDLGQLCHEQGWDQIVVKPVASAGSFQTRRFARAELAEAQSFLDRLVPQRDMMVQRFMPSVESYGERSLVFIDGQLSHAIRKSPRLAGGIETVSGEVPIEADERAFADRVLAPLAKELLYARVDIVRDEENALRLMELELIEPSLFFLQCPRALDRFVDAILAWQARTAEVR